MPKRLLAPLIALLLCVPEAVAWKSEYREGQSLMEIGAYSQAIAQFEAALGDPKLRSRDRPRVVEALEEARSRAAGQSFARGETLAASGEIVGALNAFNRAMTLDPENAAYRERFERERSSYESSLTEVRGFADAARQSGDYETAITNLEARARAANNPQIWSELDRLRAEAVAFFASQSDSNLKAGRYDSAYQAMMQAAGLTDDPARQRQAEARKHLSLSEEALRASNYTTAYNELDRALQLEPDNAEMQAFEQRFVNERAGALYNEAMQARGAGRLALARQNLATLTRIKPGFADAEKQLYEVNQAIASRYYSEAGDLIDDEQREHYGRALAYYLLVAEQRQALFPDIGQRIDEAKTLLNQELELRVVLDISNSSGEPGAGGVVKAQILTAMRNDPQLRQVSVMERDALDDILTEQGLGQAFLDPQTAVQVKKIKGVQAGLYIDIVKLEAFEAGADTPRYGNQRYENGTRWVNNPRYGDLQGELSRAQQALLRAQTEHNQALADQNSAMQNAQNSASDNPWARAAGALAIIGGSFSEKNLRDAEDRLELIQSELSYTDSQIEEPVYADFRYKIFDLTLKGEAVLSYRVVDYTTSDISDIQSVTVRDEVKDTYVPGDPGRGVYVDPKTLPTPEEFKNVLLERGKSELLERLRGQFSTLASSYFTAAQRAAQQGLEDAAIENYVRYLYSAPDLEAPQVEVANRYIYDQLGLSLLQRG